MALFMLPVIQSAPFPFIVAPVPLINDAVRCLPTLAWKSEDGTFGQVQKLASPANGKWAVAAVAAVAAVSFVRVGQATKREIIGRWSAPKTLLPAAWLDNFRADTLIGNSSFLWVAGVTHRTGRWNIFGKWVRSISRWGVGVGVAKKRGPISQKRSPHPQDLLKRPPEVKIMCWTASFVKITCKRRGQNTRNNN